MSESKPGMTADADGNPAIDPTLNVRELVVAAIERQDDLRAALAERIDIKVDGNDRLSAERHESTRRELANIEDRRLEHKKDTRDTVDTAFAGAEKAIAKSERAAADQIKSVEGSVDDLKDRVLRLETQQQTKTETRSDSRAGTALIATLIAVTIAFLMLAVSVVVAVLRGTG